MSTKKRVLIDMWYKDKFEPKKYRVDACFYPQGSFGYQYRGNIYNEDGKVIGDYATDDSCLISENFIVDFGE